MTDEPVNNEPAEEVVPEVEAEVAATPTDEVAPVEATDGEERVEVAPVESGEPSEESTEEDAE